VTGPPWLTEETVDVRLGVSHEKTACRRHIWASRPEETLILEERSLGVAAVLHRLEAGGRNVRIESRLDENATDTRTPSSEGVRGERTIGPCPLAAGQAGLDDHNRNR